MRFLTTAVGVFVFTTVAAAQFPGQPNPGYQQPFPGGYQYAPTVNSNVMPNIYNPRTQPLSPYLNLLRGGNPGVNYYYGVRPGTIGMGGIGSGGAPFMAAGGNRPVFFPQLTMAPDPVGGGGGPGDVLAPAGHPVVFGNTLGFFPGSGGQAGGARPGLAGVGTTRAPGRK